MASAADAVPDIPSCILEPMAEIAAARIAWTLSSEAEITRQAGLIWDWNLRSTCVQESRVVGIHACSFCGLHRPNDSLSTAGLVAMCQALWFQS